PPVPASTMKQTNSFPRDGRETPDDTGAWPATGSGLVVAKGVGEQSGGDVDNGNDPFVGHARRSDDPQRAHDGAVDAIRRGNDRDILERNELGVAPYIYLHSLRTAGDIEQLQEVGLFLEKREHAPQAVHVGRDLGDVQQLAFTR